jgi:MFS family permease
MLLAGALCRRFGSLPMTVVSVVLLSAALVLPALAGSALALGLLLAVFGGAYGCLNVAMNSVAVDLVAALRRPVMPGFHAAWSFGGLAGAALGGLLGPPAIGFLASESGLRAGLTTLAFLALAAAVIARLSRDDGPVAGSGRRGFGA